ncbi:hypothetical protein CP987_11000 [Morganella morganii]|nr:hypothetical protein CP987_11000 [Morganella morganii]
MNIAASGIMAAEKYILILFLFRDISFLIIATNSISPIAKAKDLKSEPDNLDLNNKHKSIKIKADTGNKNIENKVLSKYAKSLNEEWFSYSLNE